MRNSMTNRSMRRFGAAGLAAAALSMTLASGVLAQDAGNRRGGGDPAERSQRMEERRAQMADQLKEQLGATDEDFALLGPMIADVARLSRETQMGQRGQGGRGGRGGGDRGQGGGGPGGPGGGGPDGAGFELSDEATAVRTATEALQTTLDGDSATTEQLQAAVDGLRDAREAHAAKLTAAREELRGVLVARQEAVLVLNGILD